MFLCVETSTSITTAQKCSATLLPCHKHGQYQLLRLNLKLFPINKIYCILESIQQKCRRPPASLLHHHHHHQTMMNCHVLIAPRVPCLLAYQRTFPANIDSLFDTSTSYLPCSFHWPHSFPLHSHLALRLPLAPLNIDLLPKTACNNVPPPTRNPKSHRHIRHDHLQQHHRPPLPHRRRTLSRGHQHSVFVARSGSLSHRAPRPLRSRQ